MTYLIDTNVLSEVRKGGRCDPEVARWWSGVGDDDLYLSVLVLGEIRKGVEILRRRDPVRASAIEAWLAEIGEAFSGRILPVDQPVAEAWGRLNVPDPVPVIDGLLAATAMIHNLILVTRNVSDIAGTGARFLDPFTAPG